MLYRFSISILKMFLNINISQVIVSKRIVKTLHTDRYVTGRTCSVCVSVCCVEQECRSDLMKTAAPLIH